MNIKAHSCVHHKLKILAYGKEHRNVSKTCCFFGISRESYYKWKRDYAREGEKALVNSKPCPQNPKISIPQQVEDLIIYLRTNYYPAQLRISWYLKRYHDLKVSSHGVYSVLKRNGLNRFPQHQRKRSMEQFKRLRKASTRSSHPNRCASSSPIPIGLPGVKSSVISIQL